MTRQTDGWREITDFVDQAVKGGYANVSDLWKLAGQARWEEIEHQLRAFPEFDAFLGRKMAQAFRFIMLPDDVRGEFLRVWVMAKRVKR
jgi:hypothetical protein